ncbi:hypothetical protein CHELA20_53936 [Hyphomicrobiales bacterium]|nr:hypothetical protein CHELA41_20991 [Hyphomicrobiales bacterium]CAH1685260.1 hypothetical protein CHELA20_53936 [Hyphomicrobiales bacterium]
MHEMHPAILYLERQSVVLNLYKKLRLSAVELHPSCNMTLLSLGSPPKKPILLATLMIHTVCGLTKLDSALID